MWRGETCQVSENSSSVTANASGAKTASALYKAFGETRFTSGALSTDYKFTGQREESALGGIYFFQSRWFDPTLGRFMSPDTIVPTSTQGTQAWDRYAFVNNNPVRYTDPTGHGVDCGMGENCMGSQTNSNDPPTGGEGEGENGTCSDPNATNFGAAGSCVYPKPSGDGLHDLVQKDDDATKETELTSPSACLTGEVCNTAELVAGASLVLLVEVIAVALGYIASRVGGPTAFVETVEAVNLLLAPAFYFGLYLMYDSGCVTPSPPWPDRTA
ncbi:MAG: RHS repeat-associated core domain-containing protein [Chloroflexi bacterium]|nr:RHS repeat-associated core domain-containing protein [Chloroflexota bacterium]